MFKTPLMTLISPPDKGGEPPKAARGVRGVWGGLPPQRVGRGKSSALGIEPLRKPTAFGSRRLAPPPTNSGVGKPAPRPPLPPLYPPLTGGS